QRMTATALAIQVNAILEKHCPLIVDPGFTSHLEEMMKDIENGKTSRRRVLAEATEHLRPVMLNLVQREEEIGGMLGATVTAQRASDVTFSSPCPNCGLQLKIVRSRKTGKRFIGHAGTWDKMKKCEFSAPLPQYGSLTLLAKHCTVCGFQMVQAKSPDRRPLVSCPRCYVNRTKQNEVGRKNPIPQPATITTS
ncbi:MAG TPA: hypothetical protein VE177_08375, partial [Candidatus Binatus sp.]|nr:hypothetical protein [Candidatus Binatus sp.]